MKFSFVIDVSATLLLKVSGYLHRFRNSEDEVQRVSFNLLQREPSTEHRGPYLNFDFNGQEDALDFLKGLRDHLDETIEMLNGAHEEE